jgi:cyclin B
MSISPLRFLEHYGKVARLEEKNFMLARYLIEMTLLEYRMLTFPASLIASAAIYLVHKIRKNQ